MSILDAILIFCAWSAIGILLIGIITIGDTDWTSQSFHEDNASVVIANKNHPLHFTLGFFLFYAFCGPIVFICEFISYRNQLKHGREPWYGYKHINKNQQSKYRDN